MKKQSNLSRLLDYAGTYRILSYLSWVLAAAGALCLGVAAETVQKVKDAPTNAEYEHLRDEWRAGRISARAAARQLGVAHRTFMKWVEQENSDC